MELVARNLRKLAQRHGPTVVRLTACRYLLEIAPTITGSKADADSLANVFTLIDLAIARLAQSGNTDHVEVARAAWARPPYGGGGRNLQDRLNDCAMVLRDREVDRRIRSGEANEGDRAQLVAQLQARSNPTMRRFLDREVTDLFAKAFIEVVEECDRIGTLPPNGLRTIAKRLLLERRGVAVTVDSHNRTSMLEFSLSARALIDGADTFVWTTDATKLGDIARLQLSRVDGCTHLNSEPMKPEILRSHLALPTALRIGDRVAFGFTVLVTHQPRPFYGEASYVLFPISETLVDFTVHFSAAVPPVVWAVEGLLHSLCPGVPTSSNTLRPDPSGRVAKTYASTEVRLGYGVAWRWRA